MTFHIDKTSMDKHTLYFLLVGFLLFCAGDFIARATAYLCLGIGGYRFIKDITSDPSHTKKKYVNIDEDD
jgi:hypothetical protein